MYRFIVILAVALTCFTSCNSIETTDSGRIVGLDIALCACCGGYILEIDNSDGIFRFTELPSGNMDIDLNTLDNGGDPIEINFSYEVDFTCQDFQNIIFTEIELAE